MKKNADTTRKGVNAQLTLDGELIVDNFAGNGGASTGLELAFGRTVDIAVNHDPDAIKMHQTNHPWTKHYQEDVYKVSPKKVCNGHPVGLAWFSPTCTHFSKAKGLPLVDRHIRGLAWVTLRWVEEVRPRVLMLENVPEFQSWGPLMPDPKGRGEVPDPDHRGETFQAFIQMLTTGCKERNAAFYEACQELKIDPNGEMAQHLLDGYGYDVEFRELVAADYGAATTRKRFFMVARCDGRPIVWPEPTHAPRNSEAVKRGEKLPWKSAAEILDWSQPCPSIFDTKEEIREKYDLKAQRPLAPNTMARVIHGLDKHVIRSAEPYIIEVNHKGEYRGQDIKDPLHTVTGKLGTGLCDPILTPWTVTNTSNSVGSPVTEPVNTARTCCGGGQMLCGATLVQYHAGKGGETRGQSLKRPLMTVDTANRHGLAMAYMTEYYGTSKDGRPVTDPLCTVTSREKAGAVAVSLSKYYGGVIGASVRDPMPTVTAIDHNALQTAQLVNACELGFDQLPTISERERVKVQPGQDMGHWPEIRALLNEHCGYDLKDDEVLLLKINGIWFFISDIGLRMLMPRELHDSHGFPKDYIIDHDYKGNYYPKGKQVARCGNSVPPPFATALARANFPEWCNEPALDTMQQLEDRIAV